MGTGSSPGDRAGLAVDAVVERDGFRVAVQLAAGAGETVGVIGDIGRGKSTVLSLIAGLTGAAQGFVRGPLEVWDDPAAGIWVDTGHRGVSHLPQRAALVDDVAAIDQVAAAAADPHRTGNGSADAARGVAEGLLDELGVPAQVYERAGWTLSGGETQRICLARTFATGASVVLLDDPYRALDARSARLVRGWLTGRLAGRTAITVVACSDPQDTIHLADRLVDLDVERA